MFNALLLSFIFSNSSHIPLGESYFNFLDRKPYGLLLSSVLFLLAVGLFLLAIELVSGAVLILGKDSVESILLVTSNPFIGLFIGLLATALIQSSSTVTAMTVAIVASGSLSLANAIPIVMGANIGTTLTSTLVSLSFITNRNEFRKAISAGTIHDFFNIFTALIVFPLEYYYGALSYCAKQLTSLFGVGENTEGILGNGVEMGYSQVTNWLLEVLPQNVITLLIGLVLLFLSIKFLSSVIYSQLIGPSKDRLKRYVFNDPYKSFGWGTLVTAGVQSSSITTSLIVPLVASGKVKLNNAFPFIMGANIGTTITALLAAFNRSEAAISLAFVHLLFNLIGVIIFLPFPVIRRIPVMIAYRFGALTFDSRLFGFSYIIVSFFLLPFTLIYFSSNNSKQQTYEYEVNYLDASTGSSRILFDYELHKSKTKYNLFSGQKSAEMNVPDTSVLIEKNQSQLIGPDGVINYDLNLNTFGQSGQILLTSDTSSYSYKDIRMSGLRFFRVNFDNGDEGLFWIHNQNKLVVKSEYYDYQGQLLKSSKLLSIQ